MIHAAEGYSLAVLENLVHFNLGELPPRLSVVQLRIPAKVSRELVKSDQLPGWRASQPDAVSQDFGDRWYDEERSAVLIVPSVISPFEYNVLIHQAHPQTRSIKVGNSSAASMDERLLALLRGPVASSWD